MELVDDELGDATVVNTWDFYTDGFRENFNSHCFRKDCQADFRIKDVQIEPTISWSTGLVFVEEVDAAQATFIVAFVKYFNVTQ